MRTSFLKMPVMAMVLGLGLVVSQSAFRPAPSKRTSIQWERLSPSGTDWRISSGTPKSCNSASDLCKAYFDYDPNGQTDEYNTDHLDDTQPVSDNGYVTP